MVGIAAFFFWMEGMRSFEDHVHSFVIRVWQEPREIEGAGPEWRGRIEHVQSGEGVYFRSLDKLVEFIVASLSDADRWASSIRGKRGMLARLARRLHSHE
jgi:hypothetical protein